MGEKARKKVALERRIWKQCPTTSLSIDGKEYVPVPFPCENYLYQHAYTVGNVVCCIYDEERAIAALNLNYSVPNQVVLFTREKKRIGIAGTFTTSPEHVIRGVVLVNALIDWDGFADLPGTIKQQVIPPLIEIYDTYLGVFWDAFEWTNSDSRYFQVCMARLVQKRKSLQGGDHSGDVLMLEN